MTRMRKVKRVTRQQKDAYKWVLFALVAVLLCLTVALAGCAMPGMIRAEPLLGPTQRLVDRHDAYLEDDMGLTPLKRRANKRDGELILKALNTALEETDEETE